MQNLSPTERFSSRAEAYIRHRPSYPKEIIDYLKAEAGLTLQSIIADIGSGTGFLSKLFLDNGNTVYGVEPNNPMREIAEKYLSSYKNFISGTGRAEQTFLEESSVDFITAGQAFHWFEPAAAKKEFTRIAKEDGKVVLIWNRRDVENDTFQKTYEEILNEFIPEYKKVTHKRIDVDVMKDFVSSFQLIIKSFENYQDLNFDDFIGRLTSSSYCPDESSEVFSEIKKKLIVLFDQYAVNGIVRFNYKTMVYWGRIK